MGYHSYAPKAVSIRSWPGVCASGAIPASGRSRASTLIRLLNQIIYATAAPIHTLRADVPEELEEIVTTALQKDLMVDLLLVLGKRLVKSPKVYVRDSGITHALLGLGDKEALLGHPVVGSSWEGFVIENILLVAPARADAFFYRASGGAEIDLILTFPGKKSWAIEIKRRLDPKPAKGFYSACKDVKPQAQFVVYPGKERFFVSRDVEAISVNGFAHEIATVA